MSLFSSSSSNNSNSQSAIKGYRPQSSTFGQGVAIVLGTARLAGVVIWVGDWTSNPVSQGGKLAGKGSGGGKGGQQLQYIASFIICICQGPVVGLGQIWKDRSQYVQEGTQSAGPGFFANGAIGQSPWPHLTGYQALGYSEMVLACYQNANLGTSGSISNYNYEIYGQIPYTSAFVTVSGNSLTWTSGPFDFTVYAVGGSVRVGFTSCTIIGIADSTHMTVTPAPAATGGGIPIGWDDALASEAIYFLLNDFNAANINATLIGSMAGAGGITNYCLANGLGISPVVDQQNTLASYLTEWLLVANSEAFCSEGLIKFATYGDKAVTGSGVTFTPNLTPVYNLSLDSFVVGEDSNTAPVSFSRVAAQDINNHMSVEWTNRGNQYNVETMTDEDSWSVQYQVGKRNIASTITAHSVCEAPVAQQVLTVQLKRSVYITRKVAFTLGWAFSLLEPMDLVTVPEQYPSTGTVGVRILTIDEDDNGNLSMTGEVLPFPILNPALHPKQGSGGFTAGFNTLPGTTNKPVFFEITPDMANVNFAPVLTLLIALSGGPNWGGCSVFLSKDGGANYSIVGTQNLPSVMGTTTGAYPYSDDPDTTNTLSVTVLESLGTITSVAQSVADNFKSLLLVDDELMAYEYATLTGAFTYDFNSGTPSFLDYMRRGVFGTYIVPHSGNAPFTLIDGNQFEFQLQPSDIGQTLWFKFPAFNRSQQQEQDVSIVTAYPFTVRGSLVRSPLPLQPYCGFNAIHGAGGTDKGMRMQQVSVNNADGSVSAGVAVTLIPPANIASQLIKASSITSAVVSGGGSIAAGTYLVAFCGLDTNLQQTDFALTTVVAGSGSSTITVTPAYASGTVGYQMWLGTDIDELVLVAQNQAATPATVAITSAAAIAPIYDALDFIAYPAEPLDAVYDHTLLTAYAIRHGGVWGDAATSYGSFTVTFANANFTLNQFAGYKLKLYASDVFQFIPQLEATIISNTAGPGSVLTLDIDPTTFFAHSPFILSPTGGDVWVCRFSPTVTSTGFSDPNIVNSYEPAGSTVNAEIGAILIAIEGTGAGQIFNYIKSNTATAYTIQGNWAVTPDSTTIFVVLYPLPFPPQPGQSGQTNGIGIATGTFPIHVGGHALTTGPKFASIGTVPVPNQDGLSVLVIAQASDGNGNVAEFGLSPMQEAYIFGDGGSSLVNPGYFVITPSGGNATIDLANGLNQDLVLNASAVTILAPIYTGGIINAGLSFSLYMDQDSTGGRAAPAFTGGASGFVSNTASQITIDGTPSTRTSVIFTFHGTYWSIDSPPNTGAALS